MIIVHLAFFKHYRRPVNQKAINKNNPGRIDACKNLGE
jgi:hypothetical protein